MAATGGMRCNRAFVTMLVSVMIITCHSSYVRREVNEKRILSNIFGPGFTVSLLVTWSSPSLGNKASSNVRGYNIGQYNILYIIS